MEHPNPTAAAGEHGDDVRPSSPAASGDVEVRFEPALTGNGGTDTGAGAGAGAPATDGSGGKSDEQFQPSASARKAVADAAAEAQQSEEVLAQLGVARQRRSSMMAVRSAKSLVMPAQEQSRMQQFAESAPFNTFIILCIVINAVLIGTPPRAARCWCRS